MKNSERQIATKKLFCSRGFCIAAAQKQNGYRLFFLVFARSPAKQGKSPVIHL